MLIPGMTSEIVHFSWHRRVETLILCSYCCTMTQINESTTTGKKLHCNWQQPEDISKSLGYYLSTVQKLIPGITGDSHPFSIFYHCRTKDLMLPNYCWTMGQIPVSVTITDGLHYILQRLRVTL